MSTAIRRIATLVTSIALVLTSSGIVLADDVSNNLDATLDATLEVMNLTLGGPNGTAGLLVTPRNLDGKNGCNLTGSTTLVVAVGSSNAGVATVSPSSITFTGCGNTPTITVTPVAIGSATVSLSQASNTTGASFNLDPAAFTVDVASPPAPPNTPPALTVPAPIIAEATSSSGAAVTYSATAADAEDEPDPAPLCSPASGSVFALGTTTVHCSVTDSNGSTTNGSFTVTTLDTIEPLVEISTTAAPAGTGWYNVASSGTGGITVEVSTGDAVGVTNLECSDGSDPIGGLATTGGSFTVYDGEHAISCAAQDAAGNSGGDAETFRVDQAGPTISADVAPAPNGVGWNNSDVTVSYTCDDATSGVASCPGDDAIVADGTYTLDRNVTDNAGNGASTQVVVNLDGTKPTIVGSRSPGANEDGWNNEEVTVHFECDDADGSGIASCTTDEILSSEGADQSADGTAVDNAGNANSATVSGINIDTTPPEISATRTPANDGGWNNGPVTVTFSCEDGLSGVKTLTDPVTVDEEVTNASVTGSCTDTAGNTSSTTVDDINIDLTAPEITGSRTPDANGDGWNNGDVTVSFSCTDAGGSGLDDVSGPTTLSGEGADQGVTGTCTDIAGNGSSASVENIDIDRTAPSIEGAASPAPNAAGWNHTPVSVSYTCGDGLSGIESCGPDETLDADGSDQSSTGTAVDKAGNVASATVEGIDIDQVEPSVDFSGVADGATYVLGSVPVAGCLTHDDLSGVKEAAVLSQTGGPIGQIDVTCGGAEDYAGNHGARTIHYFVVYAWNGFFKPVDNSPTFNRVKAGSAVPVKFSLGGYQGLGIMAPVYDGSSIVGSYPTSKETTCDVDAPTDSIETVVSAGGSSLAYDAAAGQYVYVWKTEKSWAGTCRQLIVKLVDGSYHRAYLKFTKP